MFKILMCGSKRFGLDQLNVNAKVHFILIVVRAVLNIKYLQLNVKIVTTKLPDLLEIIFQPSTVPVNILTKM